MTILYIYFLCNEGVALTDINLDDHVEGSKEPEVKERSEESKENSVVSHNIIALNFNHIHNVGVTVISMVFAYVGWTTYFRETKKRT